jgi:hypothetical protein
MQTKTRFRWALLVLVWSVAVLLLPACRKTDGEPSRSPSDQPAGAGAREIWDAYFLEGAKIGYGHSVVRHEDRAGEPLIATDSTSHLKLERFGQSIEQQLKLATLETPDGQLLEFRTEVAFGPTPVVVNGHIDGDSMVIQTSTQGAVQENRLAWSSDIRGFFGIDQSLEEEPLEPGQSRALRMLMPLLNDVAEVKLSASGYESTGVMGRNQQLLRIESTARLSDGNVMSETLWTNRSGDVIKRRIEGMGQESFRTTEKLAKADAPAGGPTLDIGFDTIVKVDPPLIRAHRTRKVRYGVALSARDPAGAFSVGPTQSIRSLGPHSAEVTVRSVRPGQTRADGKAATTEPLDNQYTAANSVLQIGDPRIVQMAKEARAGETDPTAIALALERYVYDNVSINDFSQAFATAAEVAETRAGDCTEHAVLLAALARACDIGSRVAIGLVYVEGAAGFGYHMWTEVFLDGQWIPLDATLGQGGIGAGHLKLVDSSLDGANAYSAFLPVAQVVGQLKIEVLEAE